MPNVVPVASGHCEDCRWWREDLPGLRDARYRLCWRSPVPYSNRALFEVWALDPSSDPSPYLARLSSDNKRPLLNAHIETAPEFGCVEWMPKRELSNA